MSTSLYDKQGFRVNQQGKRMLGNDYGNDVGELALNNQERSPENQPLSSPEAISTTTTTNNSAEALGGAQADSSHETSTNKLSEEKALLVLLLKQRLKERLGDNELVDKFSHLFDEIAAQSETEENFDGAVAEKMTIAKLSTAVYREMLAHVGLASVLDSSDQDWERAQFQELSFLDNFNTGGSGDPQEIGDQFLRSVMAISRLKGQSLNEASQEDWQKLSQTWEHRNQELHGGLLQVLREHLLLLSHLRELYLSTETPSAEDELVDNTNVGVQELMNIQASAPSIGETADGSNPHAEQLANDSQQLTAVREQISQLTDEEKQSAGAVAVMTAAQHEVPIIPATTINEVVASAGEVAIEHKSATENKLATTNELPAVSDSVLVNNAASIEFNTSGANSTPEQGVNPAIIEPPSSGEYGGNTPLASNVMQSSVVLPKLG